jgi:hypothetical protein
LITPGFEKDVVTFELSCLALLVGMQNGTNTLKNSLIAS